MNQLLHKIDEYFKEIASYRPFKDKNLLNNIKNFYRIECTWSSNSLEGNSYTISETKVLLEDGLTAGDRKSTRLNSSHIATSRMPSSA